jgi:hypothetical protein
MPSPSLKPGRFHVFKNSARGRGGSTISLYSEPHLGTQAGIPPPPARSELLELLEPLTFLQVLQRPFCEAVGGDASTGQMRHSPQVPVERTSGRAQLAAHAMSPTDPAQIAGAPALVDAAGSLAALGLTHCPDSQRFHYLVLRSRLPLQLRARKWAGMAGTALRRAARCVGDEWSAWSVLVSSLLHCFESEASEGAAQDRPRWRIGCEDGNADARWWGGCKSCAGTPRGVRSRDPSARVRRRPQQLAAARSSAPRPPPCTGLQDAVARGRPRRPQIVTAPAVRRARSLRAAANGRARDRPRSPARRGRFLTLPVANGEGRPVCRSPGAECGDAQQSMRRPLRHGRRQQGGQRTACSTPQRGSPARALPSQGTGVRAPTGPGPRPSVPAARMSAPPPPWNSPSLAACGPLMPARRSRVALALHLGRLRLSTPSSRQ